MDLKLMNMVPAETVNSDEFFFQEMGYQREPLQVTAVSATVSYVALKLIDMTIGLRVKPDAEREGLDIAEHGEQAYHK